MTLDEYLTLMQFPSEWRQWGLLPNDFALTQMSMYQDGNENASEHDRHGVFQWWLKRQPDSEVLVQLARLSWLDPDQPMARYVRECIAKQPNCNAEVKHVLGTPYQRA